MSDWSAFVEDAVAYNERLTREISARLRRHAELEVQVTQMERKLSRVEKLCNDFQEAGSVAVKLVRNAIAPEDDDEEIPASGEVIATITLPPGGIQPGEVIQFEQSEERSEA